MFSETLRFLKDYYNFRKISKPLGGHGIHSPFVYDLYTLAIDSDKKEAIFDSIDRLRNNLLKDKTSIAKSVYGAKTSKTENKTTVSEVAKRTSVPPYMGRLLYRLVNYFQPATIIELGTSTGISTLYLAAGNQDSQVFTIEGDPNLSRIASENLNKLATKNVSLITGDFDAELPSLLSKIEKIDLVFIDGNHTEEATLRYFKILSEKAHSNSLIIFDDIRWSDSMKNAWRNICDDQSVSISIDLFNCGLVFFRKGVVKQHFNLRYGPF
ncbi:MAG: O-methyltransferase [Tenuifilaceae bacterium]